MKTPISLRGTDRQGINTALIKIFSYRKKNPMGICFFSDNPEGRDFNNLTQMLILIEEMLGSIGGKPVIKGKWKSNNSKVGFPALNSNQKAVPLLKGDSLFESKEPIASFKITIVFTHFESWQGTISWSNRNIEQHFRSALEMVFLMDEALSSVVEQRETTYEDDIIVI